MLDPALAVGRRLRPWALTFALGALCLCAPATAELSQKGGLFVRFDGGISPRALPRIKPAPISVRIEGQVKAPHGQAPPPLREITIALNRAGRLDTTGLASCNRKRVELATPTQAVSACKAALVGSGGIVVKTSLAGQAPSLVRQSVLLFNAKEHGRSAILAHLYQATPVPSIRIVSFSLRRVRGTFGTQIVAKLPDSLNENGYLQSIFLTLGRRYVFHGEHHSYLSASCAAPAGFPGAVFPFARASLGFADGRTLSAVLTRSCRVS